ncbi:MAG: ABC transporter substrate-binding protein [Steroidobacteraceae bacterium]
MQAIDRRAIKRRSSSIWIACSAALLLSATATAQQKFVDDARRTVTLPNKVERVFAAGAPAEVLLYTLVPEKMVGRNHMPDSAALEFMPAELRQPVQIMNLPNADDANNDKELLALKPDVYIDYGDVLDDYVNSVKSVQQRTGIPGIILDGGIESIPGVYRRLGNALNVKSRGEQMARQAEQLLAKYRGILHKSTTPRAYLACSNDATLPCLEGERNGEIIKYLGAINVAGSITTAPKRPITVADMKTWNPDVIIVSSNAAAQRIRNDAAWQSIKAVAEQRVYAPPSLPFNWGPRPPSVNRLMGMMWLAYVLPGKPFDSAFSADMRNFFKNFYHVTLSDEQLQRLLAN